MDLLRASRCAEGYEISNMQMVPVNREAAILTYDVKWQAVNNDGEVYANHNRRFSKCWAHRNGRWFIVFVQSTPIGDKSPP